MRKTYYALVFAGALAVMTGCKSTPAPDSTEITTQETVAESSSESDKAAEGSQEQDAQEQEVNLADIYDKVKEAYGEDFIPSAEFDEESFENIFGISKDLYDSYIAEGPMISVHVDTWVSVKAKEGKGQEVEDLLNAYRTTLIEDSVQYPMNLPKIQASEVVRHGDYVFFVMLGTPSQEAEEQGEEEALKSAKENNQIAVSIINGFFEL